MFNTRRKVPGLKSEMKDRLGDLLAPKHKPKVRKLGGFPLRNSPGKRKPGQVKVGAATKSEGEEDEDEDEDDEGEHEEEGEEEEEEGHSDDG